MKRDSKDQFSQPEALRRFHEALRGARTAGHKTMNDIPKKNGESRAIQEKSKTAKRRRKDELKHEIEVKNLVESKAITRAIKRPEE